MTANLPGRLSPIFQPCGQGSSFEAYNIRCRNPQRDSLYFAQLQTTTMPLADFFSITNPRAPRNTGGTRFVTFSLQRLSHPPDTRADVRRTLINTGDFASRDFALLHFSCTCALHLQSENRSVTRPIELRPLPFHTFPTAFAHTRQLQALELPRLARPN